MVCLADGGCSPLHFHMWNPVTNKMDIEFSILADSCGFQEEMHPYTQTLRGSSPWEFVPDLLYMHGFCSHRNWFSYRNALWSHLCPIEGTSISMSQSFIGGQGGDDAVMVCNTSNTYWPWIHERFDKHVARGTSTQTMADGHALLVLPHACDETFMHLQTPFVARDSSSTSSTSSKRMQLCSGFQGKQDVVPFRYSLDIKQGDWSGVFVPEAASISQQNTNNSNNNNNNPGINYWMRTYSESDNSLHIGVLGNDISNDVPLGFLGASKSAKEQILVDMADDMIQNVNFFRCADHMACSNPPFTYNGCALDRLDPVLLAGNFSEINLRLCGSIGYTATEWPAVAQIGGGVCWIDMPLFPLFSQLLWGGGEGGASVDNSGCIKLWSSSPTSPIFDDGLIIFTDDSVEQTPLSNILSSPRSFFCDKSPPFTSEKMGGRCAYAARASTLLTVNSAQDSVAFLINSLNKLIRSTPNAVLSAVQNSKIGSKTRVYEHINKCSAQLMQTIFISQSKLQTAYGTWGPSGIYFALQITLFEIPVAWCVFSSSSFFSMYIFFIFLFISFSTFRLHHAMLVTLLSTIDPTVPVPTLSGMGITTLTVPLFLWTEIDRALICRNEADLNNRPVLWKLICTMNYHPSYTFSLDSLFHTSPVLLADQLADSIHTRALQDIANELPSNYGATNAFCYTKAEWKCDSFTSAADAIACTTALAQAYNTSSCVSSISESIAYDTYGMSNGTNEWLDPCGYPDHFAFKDPVEVSLEELNTLDGVPDGGFLAYLGHIQEQTIQAAAYVSIPIDFIGGGGTWNELVLLSDDDGANNNTHGNRNSNNIQTYHLPIVRVWPLKYFVQQDTSPNTFNLTYWLQSGICKRRFDPVAICSNQYATTNTDPCLYPWTKYLPDLERYIQPPQDTPSGSTTSEPVVTLHYKDGSFDIVNVCDLPNNGDSCVVQYLVSFSI